MPTWGSSKYHRRIDSIENRTLVDMTVAGMFHRDGNGEAAVHETAGSMIQTETYLRV
jgi:hypothetical protein